jgi:hypothetical protein
MLTKNISFRNTLDIVKEAGGGNIEVRIKYAYLNFDNILPKTGLELGVAHRTWIDYEDTHGWFYRAIEKGFVEASDGANLFGSADLGANLRTFFPHFSSEVGIFNGENYDHLDYSGGKFFANSIEGRATWHILGKGDKKVDPVKDQYFDVSLNTVNNFRMNAGSTSTTVAGSPAYPATGQKAGDMDRLVYQAHTVYNRPEFLVAGSLVYNQDRFDHIYGNLDNKGFSVNGEIRPFMFFPETFPTQKDAWAAFGRMDYWDIDNSGDRRLWLYGVAYRLNRYVRFILNGETADYSEDTTKTKSYSKAMFTVHVVW